MITAAELRDVIDIGPDRDRVLTGWARAVVALWETKTGRLWNRREGYVHRARLESVLDRVFWLPLYPVEELALAERRDGLAEADAVAVAEEDFIVTDLGRVELLRTTPWAGRFLVATITGGYTTATLPADILEALKAQVAFMVKRLDPDTIALNSQAFEKGSTTFMTADLHPFFEAAVRDHERHV